MPQAQLAPWMMRCAILALTSRSEAMGRVLVEAAAAEKCRIATRVGGIPDASWRAALTGCWWAKATCGRVDCRSGHADGGRGTASPFWRGRTQTHRTRVLQRFLPQTLRGTHQRLVELVQRTCQVAGLDCVRAFCRFCFRSASVARRCLGLELSRQLVQQGVGGVVRSGWTARPARARALVRNTGLSQSISMSPPATCSAATGPSPLVGEPLAPPERPGHTPAAFSGSCNKHSPARLAGIPRVVVTEHTVFDVAQTRAGRFRVRLNWRLADAVTVIHPTIKDYSWRAAWELPEASGH